MSNDSNDRNETEQNSTTTMEKTLEKIKAISELNLVVEAIHKINTRDNSIPGNGGLLDTGEYSSRESRTIPETQLIDFLHNTHDELISKLIPFFFGNTKTATEQANYTQKSGSEASQFPPLHEHQEFRDYRHIWCLTTLGHFIGKNLFRNLPGLKEELMQRIKRAFDSEKEFIGCLGMMYPDKKIQPLHIPPIMDISMRFYTDDRQGNKGDSQVEEYFLKVLNLIHKDKQYSNSNREGKSKIKIAFLKYLWLHWLENCFSDIMSLVLCDAPAILSYVHEYKFFDFDYFEVPAAFVYDSEEKLINEFFGMKEYYPVYFRFHFLINTLKYIERFIRRKYPLADKIKARIQPVIDILLEKKNIRGKNLDNYRFQLYHLRDISFSIDIKFADAMHQFIVNKIFTGLHAYIKKHQPPGTGIWLTALAFNDQELHAVDNLIYQLITGDKNIAFYQYRHILTASRYAFELFPRKALEINKLCFTATHNTQPIADKSHSREIVCIDYYFNREYYWDWHKFNNELENYFYTRNNDSLRNPVEGLDKSYHIPYRYVQIIEHIEELLSGLDQESNWDMTKKLKIMLHHYHSFRKVQQYNIALEMDIEKRVFNNQVCEGIVAAIIEHDILHLILDNLIGANFIKTDYLDCMEKTLLSLSAAEYRKFPQLFDSNYTQVSKTKRTTSDRASMILLYKSGDIFNHKRYLQVINDWYDNLGNTRQIYQEAWKGKIIGKIHERLYCIMEQTIVQKKDFSGQGVSILRKIKEWEYWHANINKDKTSIDQIKCISEKLEKVIMDNILCPSEMEGCERMIKNAVKSVCTETLLWIHFKNVRYMNKLLGIPQG